MKKNLFNRIIVIMLIFVMIFNTSLSYANTETTPYIFTSGTNVITVKDYRSGFYFKVPETGVYSVAILPIIKDYKWTYDLRRAQDKSKGDANLHLAAYKERVDENGEDVYKIYSTTIPHFYFNSETTYWMKGKNEKLGIKERSNGEEQYATIKLGTKITLDEYYEAENEIEVAWAPDKSLRDVVDLDSDLFQLNVPSKWNDGDEYIQVTAVEALGAANSEQDASFMEKLLTSFFVHTVGDGAMFLIGVVAGEPITIDKILFNEYSRTRLAFFENDYTDDMGSIRPEKNNPFLADSGILPRDGNPGILNAFYSRFQTIAIIAYLIIFLYMGVRIIFSSTGKDMAKYKKLFADWVLGVMILFLFPYVIRYTIRINDAVVSYIGTLRKGINIEEAEIIDYPGGLAFPFSYVGSEGVGADDYMSQMREKAIETGRIMYGICWLMMIKELVTFLIIYIKRMLTTMFLIVVFPLVTISYAIDKIGDGKSQAFNNWFKEYVLNVFLQTFHAINYVVVMGIIFAIGKGTGTVNFILVLIGITYLARGDKILRGIFSHMKGGGGGTVKGVAESMLATAGAVSMLKSSVNTLKNGFKNVKNLSDKRLDMADKASKLSEHKANEKWDNWNLGMGATEAMSAVVGGNGNGGENAEAPTPEQTKKVAAHAVSLALSNTSSPERMKEALDNLRAGTQAGGETQRIYEEAMDSLPPEKRAELDALMEENDAIDAMESMEHLTEAEINYNLNVLIRNRKQKGNLGRLHSLVEKNGFTKKQQDKLAKTLEKRKLKDGERDELARLRTAVYTKEDAKRVKAMKKVQEDANRAPLTTEAGHPISTTAQRKAQLESEIAKLQNDLATKRMKKVHKDQKKAQIARKTAEIARLEAAGPYFEERKQALQVKQGQAAIASRLMNPNITVDTVGRPHDKVAQVDKYRQAVQEATGALSLTEEQLEVAEAQAIIDGSDSGEYTLEEIFDATRKIRKARKKNDAGVREILRVADSDSATKKPKGFEQQVAAMVITNKKAIGKTEHDTEMLVAEAEEIIKETSDEGGIYQHILDEAGLAVEEDEDKNKTIVELTEDDSVQEIIQKVEADKEKQAKINRKEQGKELTDAKSVKTMKRELFQDRLEFTGAVIKTGTTPVISTLAGFAAAGMYAGAASDMSPLKVYGVAKLGSDAANKVRDFVVDTPLAITDEITNRASGIADVLEQNRARKAMTTTQSASRAAQNSGDATPQTPERVVLNVGGAPQSAEGGMPVGGGATPQTGARRESVADRMTQNNDTPMQNNRNTEQTDTTAQQPKKPSVFKQVASVAIFGDDNDQGVTTRHMDLSKRQDPKVQEEAFLMERIEKRKAAVERSMRNRERFAEGIEIETRRNNRENPFEEMNARITGNIRRPNLNPRNTGNAGNGGPNPTNPTNPLDTRNSGAGGSNPTSFGNTGGTLGNPTTSGNIGNNGRTIQEQLNQGNNPTNSGNRERVRLDPFNPRNSDEGANGEDNPTDPTNTNT